MEEAEGCCDCAAETVADDTVRLCVERAREVEGGELALQQGCAVYLAEGECDV